MWVRRFVARQIHTAPYWLIVGFVLFFGFGSVSSIMLARFEAASKPTMVRVVGNERAGHRRGRTGGRELAPVFEATTEDGETVRYRGNYFSYPPVHETSELVPGRINETTGVIRSEKLIASEYEFARLFSETGLACLLVGSVWLVLRYRRTGRKGLAT